MALYNGTDSLIMYDDQLSVTYASDVLQNRINVIMKIVSGATVSQPHIEPEEKKTTLIEKICAFRLIEALYSCLPPSIIRDKVECLHVLSCTI